MAGLTQRRLFTSKSKVVPLLKSIAQGFRLQPSVVFTVQQARAQLCDPSGENCVMSPD